MTKNILSWISVVVMWAGILLVAIGPLLNHIVYCFQSEKYILLLAGVIVAPVGWFHGIGLFFGWW